jgi:hypothetical protein
MAFAAGIEPLAWCVAALAGGVALWATVAAGPARSILADHDIKLMYSRVVRMVRYNVLSFIWLATLMDSDPGLYGWPVIVTVVAVMCAGGVGRDLLAQAFYTDLDQRRRTPACLAQAAGAAIVAYLLAMYAGHAAWQLPLFAAVLVCLQLRRATPLALNFAWLHWRGIGVTAVVGFNLMRAIFGGGASTGASGQSDSALVIGGMFMLSGVAFSTLHWVYVNRTKRPS